MGTYVAPWSNRGVAWSTSVTTTVFRTFVSRVKAALDGMGLVQTSDTGQMDPAAVTYPTSNSTDAGYFVYRFNDSMQGTDPIFLKITLGRGLDVDIPSMKVQVGQGSNGSGTLTGSVGTTMVAGNDYENVSAVDPPITDYAYHGEGVAWLGMHLPQGEPWPFRHWWCVSRTRDQTTGAFDARGAIYYGCTGSPWLLSELMFVRWGVGVKHAIGYTRQHCLLVGLQQADASGNKIAWPHFYNDEGVVKRAWAHWTTHSSYMPSAVTYAAASPYGVSRNWAFVGGVGQHMRGVGITGLQTNWASVLPWE